MYQSIRHSQHHLTNQAVSFPQKQWLGRHSLVVKSWYEPPEAEIIKIGETSMYTSYTLHPPLRLNDSERLVEWSFCLH